MPENTTIHSEQRGSLLTVMLPDPSMGGLTRRALTDFASCLERANDDDSVSVVIVVGGHAGFCDGLDLEEFLQADQLDDLSAVLCRCFQALALLQKPLVAVVEGRAIGFGASMICHADVIIATPNASFEAPFVPLGLLPEAASTLLLPQRIGYLRAMRFLCLGDKIEAQEALFAGLVTEIVASEPRTRATALAKRLAKLPADAVQTTRKLLRGDRTEINRRIELEVSASRLRLGDASLRRRVGLFASAARSSLSRSRKLLNEKHIA